VEHHARIAKSLRTVKACDESWLPSFLQSIGSPQLSQRQQVSGASSSFHCRSVLVPQGALHMWDQRDPLGADALKRFADCVIPFGFSCAHPSTFRRRAPKAKSAFMPSTGCNCAMASQYRPLASDKPSYLFKVVGETLTHRAYKDNDMPLT